MLKEYPRRITQPIESDLAEKMVFLAGPRQCGKTTLAKAILARSGRDGAYYNWDVDAHRRAIIKSELDETARLWVFDELHKYRLWRNWLKGMFDLHRDRHAILVTGSARLDIYRRGGDSLQGRYYFHRLHPFTLGEMLGTQSLDSYDGLPELPFAISPGASDALGALMEFGGFPEPLFGGSARKAARWRLAYGSRLVRQDIRDVENLQHLDKLELLFERLPACVGSVLSINSLREDLEVSFPTVKHWMDVLERFYSCFRVSPFGPARIKAVKKEQKLYMWDWAQVEDPAARFENLVALHLLRLVHWLADYAGEKAELRYFRSVNGHEVDFIVLRRQKPWLAVEVKLKDRPLDANLKYFLERVKVPFAFQLSLESNRDYRLPEINGARVRVVPAATFLSNLP